MKTTKEYYVENYKVKIGSDILLEQNDDPKHLINKETSQCMSIEEVSKMITPLMTQAETEGYFGGVTNPLEVKKDTEDYIKSQYNKDWKLPSLDEVKRFITNRSPNFAK
jgi:hypothetical protein